MVTDRGVCVSVCVAPMMDVKERELERFETRSFSDGRTVLCAGQDEPRLGIFQLGWRVTRPISNA